MTSQVPGFDSPEAAALAGWRSTPSANARVVSVDVRGDRAEVVIDTDPSHPDWVYFVDEVADGSRWSRGSVRLLAGTTLTSSIGADPRF